jgi:hypothetical protein
VAQASELWVAESNSHYNEIENLFNESFVEMDRMNHSQPSRQLSTIGSGFLPAMASYSTQYQQCSGQEYPQSHGPEQYTPENFGSQKHLQNSLYLS